MNIYISDVAYYKMGINHIRLLAVSKTLHQIFFREKLYINTYKKSHSHTCIHDTSIRNQHAKSSNSNYPDDYLTQHNAITRT